MAERKGFEPSIPFNGYTPLAGARLRPARPPLRRRGKCPHSADDARQKTPQRPDVEKIRTVKGSGRLQDLFAG